MIFRYLPFSSVLARLLFPSRSPSVSFSYTLHRLYRQNTDHAYLRLRRMVLRQVFTPCVKVLFRPPSPCTPFPPAQHLIESSAGRRCRKSKVVHPLPLAFVLSSFNVLFLFLPPLHARNFPSSATTYGAGKPGRKGDLVLLPFFFSPPTPNSQAPLLKRLLSPVQV